MSSGSSSHKHYFYPTTVSLQGEILQSEHLILVGCETESEQYDSSIDEAQSDSSITDVSNQEL